MDFNLFSEQVSKIKNLPLPGETSHFKMAPEFRIKLMQENKEKPLKPIRAGVLALFYPSLQYSTYLLLILRKTYEGVHSNQIGFPGGKIEKGDVDIEFTALRETQEEVGIPMEEVQIIKSLSTVYIPPSNFEVHPFLGLISGNLEFTKQESEVEAVVEVALTDFMDDLNVFTQKLSTSYAKEVEVPAFNLNGYTVWGATAMMLSEIKELLKQVL